MSNRVKEVLIKLSDLFCCELVDFQGSSLREIFESAEKQGGIMVYWGLWTEFELDRII